MKKKVVAVIPTYNEINNIVLLLNSLCEEMRHLPQYDFSIVVVDDQSPDGTANAVKRFSDTYEHISLIEGEKNGLGDAYKRGFQYALNNIHADIIIQMDADLSHNPRDISRLLATLDHDNAQMVIGSRYIDGGSIPKNWSARRILNSKAGNAVARYIAGLKPIKDCTSGFKAFDTHAVPFSDMLNAQAKGFGFQIELLYSFQRAQTRIIEIPIQFVDRVYGESKLQVRDMVEFIKLSLMLRFRSWTQTPQSTTYRASAGFSLIKVLASIAIVLTASLIVYASTKWGVSMKAVGSYTFLAISLVITAQSTFTLLALLYAWDRPDRVEKNQSPKKFVKPSYSFTALIPALHEEKVIRETILAVSKLSYPKELTETLVICRPDDEHTIQAVMKTIDELGDNTIRLIVPDVMPRNKPDKLNFAIPYAHGDVICVFDAEDSPHSDIYNVVNTVMLRDRADVVQSGVQLINFRSTWFSTLNVLEYFFWFKSVLHFYSSRKVIPLGGNTVFFKKEWIEKIKGWDANCLTEDADIGIKLSAAGARIRVIYDEVHATQEETPLTLGSFIKQRTRWNQGFLQVYKKGEWKKLPTFSQRMFVAYLLVWPEIQAALFIYIIFSFVMIFTTKLPILITLISMLPTYILMLHFIILNVGLYEFTKKYNVAYPRWMAFKVALTFIPYQILLGVSAVRALLRETMHNNKWEKTEHVNAHRPTTERALTPAEVAAVNNQSFI